MDFDNDFTVDEIVLDFLQEEETYTSQCFREIEAAENMYSCPCCNDNFQTYNALSQHAAICVEESKSWSVNIG